MKPVARILLRWFLSVECEWFMWSMIALCFVMLLVCAIRGGQ